MTAHRRAHRHAGVHGARAGARRARPRRARRRVLARLRAVRVPHRAPPFAGDDAMARARQDPARGAAAARASCGRDVPPALDELVARMLAKDPAGAARRRRAVARRARRRWRLRPRDAPAVDVAPRAGALDRARAAPARAWCMARGSRRPAIADDGRATHASTRSAARLERIADGSRRRHAGRARARRPISAAQAARCALALRAVRARRRRSRWRRAAAVRASGALPVGEVIDRAARAAARRYARRRHRQREGRHRRALPAPRRRPTPSPCASTR